MGNKISGQTESSPCGPADAAPEQGQPHAFGVADHDLVPDLENPQRQQTPTGISEIPGINGHITLHGEKKRQLKLRGGGPYGLVHVAVELVDGVVEGDEIGQGDDLEGRSSKV